MHTLPISLFREQNDQILALLIKLASIESPSTDKAAIDQLGAAIAEHVNGLGGTVTKEPRSQAGDLLLAQWGSGTGAILLLCHMDTVYDLGTLKQQPIREMDGRLYGPGVYDMKGGITIALTAIRALIENGRMPARPIQILFTSDEEIGSEHSRQAIESLAQNAALVLVLEPALTNGAIKTARKGTGTIRVNAYGRSAHAGADHAKGCNAIEELAHHVISAQKLTDYESGTTVNVGKIQGGTRTNVVPDAAHFEADFRVSHPREVLRLQNWVDQIQAVVKGARVSAELDVNRPPMPRDERMAATFAQAREIARHVGLDLVEGSTGGASDANFVSPLGIPVLDGLGPLGDHAHSPEEYVIIETLAERAALLAALLQNWQ